MYGHLVFCKPSEDKIKTIIDQFKLKESFGNARTQIWENEDAVFSIDKKVIRVFLYNISDKSLIKSVKDVFYGK